MDAAKKVRVIAERYYVDGSTDDIDAVANAMRQHLTSIASLPLLDCDRDDMAEAIEALSAIADALAGKK